MSRKDYNMIAHAVREAYSHAMSLQTKAGVQAVAITLAVEFTEDNENFNADTWYKACGFSEPVVKMLDVATSGVTTDQEVDTECEVALVCDNCGEAFDEIATANAHLSDDCSEEPAFLLRPRDEAF